MNKEEKGARVAIIGGGPVGCVAAIHFARRGWKVDVFEQRPDVRLPQNQSNQRGRSINLSLSERGLSVLRDLDLEKPILATAVPTHSRMIHTEKDGRLDSQSYSVYGDYTNSIDRLQFNVLVLEAAEKCPEVTMYFEHKLNRIDFSKGSMEFLQGPEKTKVTKHTDLIVGTDGAYSKVRGQMMRMTRMNYQQEYIDECYCELHMPAKLVEGKRTYAMDPNHLHIWPRHKFLITAIPDKDHTFTCTLFMPYGMFEAIDTNEKLMEFFATYFKDIIPLIGEETLQKDYFQNPRGSLISIKASPHHVLAKGVLLGDAAHAMVPFYGQGLNCGLQDVQVLFKVLDEHLICSATVPYGLQQALEAYSAERVEDCHAMCDLAMYNHKELRSGVTSLSYLIRRRLERWIHQRAPQVLVPLYCMVSFSTIPYSEAIRRWRRQSIGILVVLSVLAIISMASFFWLVAQGVATVYS